MPAALLETRSSPLQSIIAFKEVSDITTTEPWFWCHSEFIPEGEATFLVWYSISFGVLIFLSIIFYWRLFINGYRLKLLYWPMQAPVVILVMGLVSLLLQLVLVILKALMLNGMGDYTTLSAYSIVEGFENVFFSLQLLFTAVSWLHTGRRVKKLQRVNPNTCGIPNSRAYVALSLVWMSFVVIFNGVLNQHTSSLAIKTSSSIIAVLIDLGLIIVILYGMQVIKRTIQGRIVKTMPYGRSSEVPSGVSAYVKVIERINHLTVIIACVLIVRVGAEIQFAVGTVISSHSEECSVFFGTAADSMKVCVDWLAVTLVGAYFRRQFSVTRRPSRTKSSTSFSEPQESHKRLSWKLDFV